MLAVKRYKNKKSALKINQNKPNQDDFAHLDNNLEKKTNLSGCVLEFVQNLFSYELCFTN